MITPFPVPVYLYEALQSAGHHQWVFTALESAFKLLPLHADAVKWHENLHGLTWVKGGQMLCLLLHQPTQTTNPSLFNSTPSFILLILVQITNKNLSNNKKKSFNVFQPAGAVVLAPGQTAPPPWWTGVSAEPWLRPDHCPRTEWHQWLFSCPGSGIWFQHTPAGSSAAVTWCSADLFCAQPARRCCSTWCEEKTGATGGGKKWFFDVTDSEDDFITTDKIFSTKSLIEVFLMCCTDVC